tara:strand:+ start:18 stop:290 length:273 start_codon:yes stop_codon:yes gene_type:complete
MNTSAKALIEEINSTTISSLTIIVDEDENVAITLDGLVYENAAHYIDIYADHANVIKTACVISTKIINAYEYERDQLAQKSIILTNENRF